MARHAASGDDVGTLGVATDAPMRIEVLPAPNMLRSPARWLPRGGMQPTSTGSLIDRVLAARGIVSAADVFLTPQLMHLHDPSLLAGVDRAAERLLHAARSGEAIVVFGDYDADGVCASAILYHMLRALAPDADVRTYIPHRLEEGYGLNAGAIAELADAGARVIVSVDCGITATEPARIAEAAGVDLIITDHHTTPEEPSALPRAFALVHPRLPGHAPAYPFGELCGAGVAFKLAWRLATLASGGDRVGPALRELLLDLLGLAALATIADVVPLVGENRVIARFGLPRVRHTSIEGLRALLAASRLDGEKIDETKAGFSLAPRLNAAGRLGHAREALELLTTARGERAAEIAASLDRTNTRRQSMQKRIVERACAMVEERGLDAVGRRAIVLADEDWHAGVVGIACSQLVERYNRPTILMQRASGECKGSGRSIDGFNLHAALCACGHMLDAFGGHEMAAGLRMDASRLDEFAEAFTHVAGERLADEDLVPSHRFDALADLAELTHENVRTLDGLAPFGRGNPHVQVMVRNVRVAERPETFGRDGSHLRVGVSSSGGRIVRLVGWKMAGKKDAIPAGAGIDAIIRPKVSAWNGRVEPEIVDLRPTTD
ncbi:MAG: single-stranded-DNA-specific exonuclease RecJ [Phycisphaerales bacterium]|jgi:single-stranded-DNA-specific exonuclease|nr:single-stranded-DNA-specific exonuclease RecJ [Phycisphaerales bacterium]